VSTPLRVEELRRAVYQYDEDMAMGGGYEDMVRASGPVWDAVRNLLREPAPAAPITGRDVHREWRDGMLAQGRDVAPERMAWDTLDQRDRDLDDRIAANLTR
jgi:hypothetical protein